MTLVVVEEGIVGHVGHLAAVKVGDAARPATWTTFPPETGEALAPASPGRRGRAPTTSWSRNATRLLVAYLRARRSSP